MAEEYIAKVLRVLARPRPEPTLEELLRREAARTGKRLVPVEQRDQEES